jgi:hypothetical protein
MVPSGHLLDRLLVMVFRPDAPVRPATVNADGSGFTVLAVPQLPPDIDMGCRVWSPDATRLLCQAIRFGGDPSLNGIYTIRAADGGGLTRLTVNPTRHGAISAGVTSPATSHPTAPGSSSCEPSPAPGRSPTATRPAPCSWRTPTAPAYAS